MNSMCSVARLESALAGNLPAGAEQSLHEHLEVCDECAATLERMAGGEGWCQEAAALLPGVELDAMAPMQEPWSEADFTVEHLEPTDEPEILGRLGGYDVLQILGHGGMGVVLKGYDRELKRCVAIKVLAPNLAQSSLARKRFAREAQAAAAVVHPNVLAIHQVQAQARLPFLVMPLVAGQSLAQRLAAEGTLELKEILRIGMQAAAGLAAAHEQGLVHRDVKPANILLEKGVERVVLTDFGLARAADDVALTRYGVIAGTPQYMSPEQARGEPLDGRSDLFSLGCVLYEMATGVAPFRADSTIATLRRLVDEAPRAMESLNPELPPWFTSIVHRLLEKDPARRFGSAQELSELLEGCLAHVQQPASVSLPEGLRTRTGSQVRSFVPRTLGVLAMLGVFAIGLLGFMVLAADPPDIAGQWSGGGWGQVDLKESGDGQYSGTYTDTFGDQQGEIALKWSPIERRYHGTWREGQDRFGEISVRLVEGEIRGAWTVDRGSKINPATPRLADLTWTRSKSPATSGTGATAFTRVPFEVGATLLRGGDRITIEEVRGTSGTIEVGNMYEVRGTYRLASRDKAKLLASITGDGTEMKVGNMYEIRGTPAPGIAWTPATPTQKTQSMTVERGEGRFRLLVYMGHEGKPHVSLYPEGGGEGFAHVYFGTGESGLKRGWWETADGQAAAQRSGDKAQATSSTAELADSNKSQSGEPVLDAKFELAGVWRLVSQTHNGKKPDGEGVTGTLTFDKHRVTSDLKASGTEERIDNPARYFSVNPKESPAQINLYGDNFLIQGIYKLDGDALTLALYGRSEIGRPRSFTVEETQPEGQTLVVMTFRRVAKHGTDPGESIYNESLKRFKFKLENIEVREAETAEEFLVRIRGKEIPEIVGAWGDPLTNSLVVVAPPEAEQGIRAELARWETERLGKRDRSLDVQREYLLRERKELLELVAGMKLDIVDAESAGKKPKLADRQARLKLFSDELQAVERKLEIVEQSIQQQGAPSERGQSPPQQTNALTDPTEPPAKTTTARPKHTGSYSTSVSGNQATIAISPNGQQIAIAGGNPTRVLQTSGTSRVKDEWRPVVDIVDAATGKIAITLKLTTPDEDAAISQAPRVSHVEATALAFSPDGKLLAVGTSIGQVKLYGAQSGELIRSLDDDEARRADYETPEAWKSLARAMGSIRSLAFSPDGQRLATCGESFADFSDVFDGVENLGRLGTGPSRLKVWEVRTGKLLHDLDGHSHVEDVAFSPDGSLLASAGRWALGATGVVLWDATTGEQARSIRTDANGGTHSVAFSPDGKQIAIGSRNFDNANDTSSTTIHVAQARSGVTLWQRSFSRPASPKAFSPDGQSLLVLCGGKSIQLLATDTGETRHEIKPLAFWSGQRWTDVAVAGQAGTLAIGGVDDEQTGIAELWDLGAFKAQADENPPASAP